jgi:FRG domain-containing protein
MNGQWIGPYSGTSEGAVVADLDVAVEGYSGVVSAYNQNHALPTTLAFVKIPNQNRFSLQVPLQIVERGTSTLLTKETCATKFPGIEFPTRADTEWQVSPNEILLNWKTDIGTSGTGKVVKSEAGSPSNLVPLPEVKSWDEFKRFVLTLEPWRFAFRGHGNSTWRLRTSFHRSGRADLMKFMSQDVNALHRHLSGLTSHHFNLADPLDYAAFLNLVQHHGYPTPILDWTQSPFVAAYFAFNDLPKVQQDASQKARILVLNIKEWNVSYERAPVVMPGFLHMTILEPLSTNNPRLVPQQSVSTVTNMDDIETYIRGVEDRHRKSYLSAIDIPATERRKVMHELALMGITAGTLFPGLEGACRQLKERFFEL